MKKLTPVLAVAAAILFTSGSAAFAQPASSVTSSSYSPPQTEHKKKPKKPKVKKGAPAPGTQSTTQ